MPSPSTDLPLRETLAPADSAGVSEVLRSACASVTPVYPIGGGTSLAYGRPATREGIGLSLAGLNRIIDYPARDMTITLEAGVTMTALSSLLRAENQQLPVDVPAADKATVGGVLAANWNGPRRLGYGPLRDYVIGIEAIDGRGMPFHGGGRVVKNVAGYDFCKLLTGSLGTLGVITRVTLKLRPVPAARGALACSCSDWSQADQLLAKLVESNLRPVAANLLAGAEGVPEESIALYVVFEGSEAEVSWQMETLEALWATLKVSHVRQLDAHAAAAHLQQCVEFPAAAEAAAVLKMAIVPSGVPAIMAAASAVDPACQLLAHAGNGIVFASFPTEPADLGRAMASQLRPLAASLHGYVTLVSRAAGGELTHQMVWGGLGNSLTYMARVKQQFDPSGILNPDRYVF